MKDDMRDLKKSMKTIALYMNTLDEKVTTINDFTAHLGAQAAKNTSKRLEIFPFKSIDDIMMFSIKDDMTLLRER